MNDSASQFLNIKVHGKVTGGIPAATMGGPAMSSRMLTAPRTAHSVKSRLKGTSSSAFVRST